MLLSRLIIFSIILTTLYGCGFTPIFGPGPGSEVRSEMRYILVEPIENRIGQQLRNHLVSDIAPLGRAYPPKYSLTVILVETKKDLAIKKSKIATRANLNFRADYKLRNKTDNKILDKGNARVTTKYNVLNQTFATLMAEKDARTRAVREISADIASKIAVFFKRKEKR